MALPRDIAHRGDRPLTIADEQEQGELQLAWGHAMWRNNLVAKVFCYLSIMRAAGLIRLKKIFEQCCQTILRLHPPRSKVTGETLVCVSRTAVMATWRQWAQESSGAYQRGWSVKEMRIAQKRPTDVHSAPTTDLAEGKLREWTPAEIAARVRDLDRIVSKSKSSVSGFQDQTSFLHAYANVTSQEFPLSGAVIRQIEDRFTKMPDWYER